MKEIEQIRKILKDHDIRIKKLEIKKSQSSKKSLESNSARRFILQLKKDGFFKKPKTFKEILDELSRIGHYYNRTSLSKPLLISVQKREIGRIGKKGNWKYVAR